MRPHHPGRAHLSLTVPGKAEPPTHHPPLRSTPLCQIQPLSPKALGLKGAQGSAGHQACSWPWPQQEMFCLYPTGQQSTPSHPRGLPTSCPHTCLSISLASAAPGTVGQQLLEAERSTGRQWVLGLARLGEAVPGVGHRGHRAARTRPVKCTLLAPGGGRARSVDTLRTRALAPGSQLPGLARPGIPEGEQEWWPCWTASGSHPGGGVERGPTPWAVPWTPGRD